MLTFWNCRGDPEEMPERAVVESSRWVSFSALMPLDQGIATAIGRHMGSNVDALLPGDARANSVSFAISSTASVHELHLSSGLGT